MFCMCFGKVEKQDSLVSTLDKLNEELDILKKKEGLFVKKVADEVQKAKGFKATNKRGAMQCLKMKKLYELEIEKLENLQMRIHEQMIMLEGGKATFETLELSIGAAKMKSIQKEKKIKDVGKIMAEINHQMENVKQIQDTLSTPIGAGAGFDEDELEAELEELGGEELEEELPQPPAPPVFAPADDRCLPRIAKAEEHEIAALRAELAL